MNGLQPYWADELAKMYKAKGISKVNTDPDHWASLRKYGKKPIRYTVEGMVEHARRGGQKTAAKFGK